MPGSSGEVLARSASRPRTADRAPRATRARRTTRRRSADRGEALRELGRREQPARLQLRTGDRPVDHCADDRLRVATLEQLEPLRARTRAAVPGRARVPPPTVVSVRRTTRSPRAATHRLAQPQLGVAALAHDACGRRRSSRCARSARPGTRLELLEYDVEAPADRIGARLDERVAAVELRARDARQVDRDALPGLGVARPARRAPGRSARARAQAGGLDARSSSPAAIEPDQQRARDDGA